MILEFLNKFILSPVLPVFLIIGGVVMFSKYGYLLILNFKTFIKSFFESKENSGVSPVKSMILALSGTLGVGNIVGVVSALSMGGAGAVFWMTVSAFVSMIIKYSEIVLSMLYRKKENGEYYGGAMYYIEKLTGKKYLGGLFAFLFIFNCLTVGNIVQTKSLCDTYSVVFGKDSNCFVLILSVVLLFCILRKNEKISNITYRLMPVSMLIYILLSVYIIIVKRNMLGEVLVKIIKDAFAGKSLCGGVFGFLVSEGMRFGVKRGLLSNEAGCGTSPTAHAKSNEKSPVKQGFFGVFEVFADTVVMCNMTSFVILLSFPDISEIKNSGAMECFLEAYRMYFGKWADYFMLFAVFVFAFSTLICQGFYGKEAVYYMIKDKKFQILFVICFCLTTAFGSNISGKAMWEMTDFVISVMTIFNLAVLLHNITPVKNATVDFFNKTKKLHQK